MTRNATLDAISSYATRTGTSRTGTPRATATNSHRNADRTPCPENFVKNRAARQSAQRAAGHTVTPAITPAMPDGFAALKAQMDQGQFTIAVADGLAGLLDIPQNVKRTGESVVLYALPRVTASAAGNDITYFEVKSYRGKRRLRMLVGAPGNWTRQTLKTQLQCLALLHILENPAAAQKLFADTTATCCRCGSPLTNKASRDRGIGPECIKKM